MLGDHIRDASAGDWRSCWLTAAKQRQGAGILKAALSRQYFSRLPRKRMWGRGVVNVGLLKGQLSLKTGVY